MSTNNTIAKNTFFLYIRMLFNMGVALYISRVVLRTLGKEDFGIYSVVAGVVILFSFLNGTMSAATLRYINVEKASSKIENVKKIFNISIVNHLMIALLVVVLAESVGIWFLNNKLDIPEDRMPIANFIYQFSILVMFVEIMRVPFNAIIVAYEKMVFYAWLGLAETFLKLTMAFLLVYLPSYDKLGLYGVLMAVVSVLVWFAYYSYCKLQFSEQTSFKFYKDFGKIKELLTFSGWILIGQVATVGATQGLSMIVNIFHGVIANAAVGIANQVDTAIYSFVGNFQVAFNPQVVQTYANKEYDRHKQLILNTSKYSFFLMALLSAPVLYFTHNLLTLWLGNSLPEYTQQIVQVVILCSLLNAVAGPFWMSATAIGSNVVKEYNITLTLINLCTLPLAYFILSLGYSPIYAFVVKLFIYTILQLFRWYFINRRLHFDRRNFLTYLFNIVLIFLLLLGLVYKSDFTKTFSIIELVLGILLIEILLIISIISLGLNNNERKWMFSFIKNKINIE